MSQQEKLNLLEEMMEIDEGTLTPDTVLSTIEEWDSLSVLSFMSIMDEKFGKNISGNEIKSKKTIADLLIMME